MRPACRRLLRQEFFHLVASSTSSRSRKIERILQLEVRARQRFACLAPCYWHWVMLLSTSHIRVLFHHSPPCLRVCSLTKLLVPSVSEVLVGFFACLCSSNFTTGLSEETFVVWISTTFRVLGFRGGCPRDS